MLQEGLSMIIYFANRFMEISGMASTGLPDGLILQHDVKKIDVDSGVATFEGEVVYTNANRLTVKAMAAAGNYILRHHSSDYECYTIIETEDDTEKGCVYFYAEDAGLDLLNEIVGEYAASAAQPAAFYINRFTRDSGWEIGINEIENLSRKLSWEGDATAAERVRSVATQFGAEIGYRFDIDKLQIRHKYIDIYEKRGRDTMYELRLGREIKRIVEKTSIADLVTCLRVTGGTPEGQNDPITLKGYTYDDGDIYIDQTYGDLKRRSALEVWSRYLSETGTGDGHIVGTYSYDTTSQQALCSHAVTALKERSQPAVNYEVELYYLPSELRIGDTVRIVDDKGELYLSARLLETEERVTDYQYHATFGDFLIKSSGISEKVQDLAEKYADLAKTRTLYTWIVYADDAEGSGISTSAAGKAYIGIAPNRVVADPDLTDVSVYKWTRIEGIQGTQGIQGPTGADGTTYYVHFAYATSSDGSQGFSTMPFDGAVYIGTCTNTTQADSTRYQDYDWSRMKGEQGDKGQYATEVVTEYYLSTSNTGQSGGSWSTTPEAYVSGRYYWRRDKITWANPADTTYTNAVLDNALNSANSTAATAKTTADTANLSANNAAKTATNYLNFDDSNGLDVGYTGTNAKTNISGSGVKIYAADNTNHADINSDGMQVFKRGSQVASFGEDVILGNPTSESKVVLDNDGVDTYVRVPVYGIDPNNSSSIGLVGYCLLSADGFQGINNGTYTSSGNSEYIKILPHANVEIIGGMGIPYYGAALQTNGHILLDTGADIRFGNTGDPTVRMTSEGIWAKPPNNGVEKSITYRGCGYASKAETVGLTIPFPHAEMYDGFTVTSTTFRVFYNGSRYGVDGDESNSPTFINIEAFGDCITMDAKGAFKSGSAALAYNQAVGIYAILKVTAFVTISGRDTGLRPLISLDAI